MARANMIESQVRTWDVLDQRILDLLSQVKRERFVPPTHRDLAFADLELDLETSQERYHIQAFRRVMEP